MSENEEQVPQRIKDRLSAIEADAAKMVADLERGLGNDLVGTISFKISGVGLKTFLNEFETAQSVSFVTRYEALPTVDGVKLRFADGQYLLANSDFIRHALNDYRSLIQNRKDSVYYQKIHKLCREKLRNRDPSKTIVVQVQHGERGDVTKEFTEYLDGECRAIREVISQLEFDYLYNGILQHSDHRYTDRFWKDYTSGELNYVFIRHATILGFIKRSLKWHYQLLGSLTFPKMGGL